MYVYIMYSRGHASPSVSKHPDYHLPLTRLLQHPVPERGRAGAVRLRARLRRTAHLPLRPGGHGVPGAGRRADGALRLRPAGGRHRRRRGQQEGRQVSGREAGRGR